ncbi:alkylation response protein AidB-like acyl-CoA dehydrogenase [Nonomuraea thailandensis]|uniref:Dibenzothiophene monooxygenase n=1 Tax=Nonomuraea thailandensis TaxID=1188745 RepID=A0A9X2GKQ7_9ACTN|nr:acyl-CoA dehydrogenase family protein [Nonomuraea thailandensis]MCP2360002.1 alkylation response protein AidB-like acyl-CoA dehydrogenase [Nonomuraea thailandensis]
MTMTEPLASATALVAEIRARRADLAEGGFRSDRDNADPADNFVVLSEVGAARLFVPAEYGGLWDGTVTGGWGDLIRAMAEVGAGDGPTCQNWGTTALVAREVFDSHAGLPEETRRELARRLLDEGLRLVASNAETGVNGKVTARPAEGGVILSGTKSFNTNSGGLGIANVGCVLEGTPGRHHVLVELKHPGVELHDDWDNMGQRGTRSQTITYHDVFVPDGWHYAASMPSPLFFGAALLLHASLMQGIGDGALDAMVGYVRTMKRGMLPQFATPAEDPLMMRRVGAQSSRLAASRALLFAAADRIETAAESEVAGTVVECFRAKVACVDASLEAAGEIHELAGARSTSNTYRLDRYWRSARTFASHDPTDTKNVYIGMYEVTGELPSPASIIRI